MLSSPRLKNRRCFSVFRRALFPVLILAVWCIPACRPKPEPGPVAFRFIDGLTDAGVLASPLKNPETAALGARAYPVNSSVLTDAGIGESAFGLKRKLALGLLSMDILFAPPRSELRYRLPFRTEGVLDFGIGIVRDVHSAAQAPGAQVPAGPAADRSGHERGNRFRK